MINPGSSNETFYNTETSSPVGRFICINSNSSGIYTIDPSTATQLDSDFSTIIISMETISTIDSQLVVQGFDSLLIQQRAQEIQIIATKESMLDSALDVILTQRQLDADAISAQNSGVLTSLLLESNKKTVNDLFLNTVAKGLITFTGTQLSDLQNIALQCPIEGGSAVYEARSLLALVEDNVYDDGILCTTAQARIGSTEITYEALNGFRLFPNPTKGQVTLMIPADVSKGKVTIVNAQGAIVLEQKLAVKSRSATISTGQLTGGIYLLNVFDNNKNIFTEKLVVIH